MIETQAPQQIPLDMLTEGQAAAYLGLSPKTLPAWRCTKRVALPYVKIGAAIRYRRADLDAFIAANTVAA
ncbi:MAG: helix-turn-helix domain-containing protein [Lautropia sp.]